MSGAVCGESAVYWLWLQQRIGFASRYACVVLDQPGTARFIYERTEDDLWALGLFPPYLIERLCDKSLNSAKAVIGRCEELGIRIFTPDDHLYPRRLLRIFDPPLALYVKGSLPNLDDELCIAVVGTRTASAYGAAMAQDIAGRLTEAGCLIVSGAARGIDTAAHQGALMYKGGRTIAVLGCGINYPYNRAGEALREIIARHGALVSEYTPDFPPSSHTFPIRNRIISGISLGVTVVEAGYISGSINTAYSAVSQSRDVFVVSPSIAPYNSEGGKRLLAEGARSVSCPLDILNNYAGLFAGKLNITDSCSTSFMHGYSRGTYKRSLSDVFNHFNYVFCGSEGIPPIPPAAYSAVFTKSGTVVDEAFEDPPDGVYGDDLYDDYIIDYKAVVDDEDARAERLVDKLWGEFVPSWHIPLPEGLPEGSSRGRERSAPADASGAPEEALSARPAAKNEAFGMALDEELSGDARLLLSHITSQPRSADELTALSGISGARLMSLLTELELYGLISAHSGKRYSLCE